MREPSEHCPGTTEQGTKPLNTDTGPYNEMKTHPGVYILLKGRLNYEAFWVT